ncbi:DUF2975 domain-containing protein [Companilactobacillus jidongensis]|uniref:DUF2975 domain-containing protein n=1 Tax=Companilactobacillus jidongensis TaxID=2486006 RepID=UPI000F7B9BEC|nr:DUF2975 domain-containing protein [Companilactobacillus jidongensis]
MKILTIFLRFILVLIIAMLSHFVVYFFPSLLGWMHESGSSMITLGSFGFFLFSSALCAYGIIIFAWRLLYLVDHKCVFTASGTFALKVIKFCFYYIAIVYLLSFFDVGELANIEQAPAPFAAEIFIVVFATSMGLFVNLLQKINHRVEEIS